MNLARLRRRAAWGLWAERLARAMAPCGAILGAYLAVACFGFGSPWVFLGVLVLAGVTAVLGIARLRRPTLTEVDRRIERASGLRHQPIAMLDDMPENDTELGAAIWRIHQRRISGSLHAARSGRPSIGAALHDPYALRGLLALLLLVGGIIAWPGGLPRIAGAFVLPDWPFAGPSVNAWIVLPAYTGAPPLVLAPGQDPVILTGSRLTVVVDGESHRPAAILGGNKFRFDTLAEDSFRADAVLHASGKLRVGPWWSPLAAWNITVVPPAAPVVTMTQPIIQDHRLLIGWHVRDPYGVAALNATLMPAGHPGALVESFGLPVSGSNSKDTGGVGKPDIGDSPYAGLPVTVHLAARNLAGVGGAAAPMTVKLPPANLQDKTAAALAGLRQLLALTPENSAQAGYTLQQLAGAPLSRIDAAADVEMGMLARQLSAHEIAADAAQAIMARLVKQIEEGPDYAPLQALTAANQALDKALRQAIATGKPLDSARLQNMLAAMHAALAQHLQALGPSSSAANAKTIDPSDLDKLAEQISEEQASGQTAKAAADLKRLEQLLSALQSAKPMSAAEAARSAAADKAAQSLNQLTQGESALLDQTNRGNGSSSGQQSLQKQLSQTRQALGKAGISVPGLGDAASAMDAAHQALTQQAVGSAMNSESSAIQALQKAAGALAASRQGTSFGEGGTSGSSQGNDEGAQGGPDETSLPGILPSTDNAAGTIQRQIIKNDDDPALPSTVHQYYHRLLNQDGQ